MSAHSEAEPICAPSCVAGQPGGEAAPADLESHEVDAQDGSLNQDVSDGEHPDDEFVPQGLESAERKPSCKGKARRKPPREEPIGRKGRCKKRLEDFVPADLGPSDRAFVLRKSRDAGYCNECGSVKDDRGEHKSRRGCKYVRTLNDDERRLFVHCVVVELQGDPAIRSTRVRAQQAESRRKYTEKQEEIHGPYTLDFGKCKTLNLTEAESTWSDKHPDEGTFMDYLKHL